MTNEWILDVLTDLKTFANKNELSALAGELDFAWQVAAMEISSREAGASMSEGKDGAGASRILYRAHRAN